MNQSEIEANTSGNYCQVWENMYNWSYFWFVEKVVWAFLNNQRVKDSKTKADTILLLIRIWKPLLITPFCILFKCYCKM